jgi:dTDP-4-dehydrorhamnose reductase
MKILIIGGSGVIGFNLIKYFKNTNDVHYTFLKNKISELNGHQLDITNKEETIGLINRVNPNIIIHTAALTNVDKCETEKQLANSINIDGTKNIIEGAKENKIKIIFLSTSAVFSGNKKENTEEDITDPISNYGVTKVVGEEIVKKSNLPYLILRIDQPYCWHEKWQHTNSVKRVIDTLKSGIILKEITDWYNTPTYVPDFVKVTAKLIQNNEVGIFHLVGPDFINRYDWALLTAENFNFKKEMINPINSKELNLIAKRANVKLNNEKVSKKTGILFLGIKDGLIDMGKNSRYKHG